MKRGVTKRIKNMKRYIKVNNRWIDTLSQQKAGFYYYENDNMIWCLPDSTMVDYIVGKLQEETDNASEVTKL